MENGEATGAAAPTAKLTRLAIRQFRNVEPCELQFGDSFNVLLGLNAAGKTTLLEIIAAALSFNFSAFEEEAFAFDYDVRFAGGSMSASVLNSPVESPAVAFLVRGAAASHDPTIRLEVRLDAPATQWTINANGSSMTVSHGSSERSAPSHRATIVRSRFLPYALGFAAGMSKEPDVRDAVPSIFRAAIFSWPSLRRFDEALGAFNDITGDAAQIALRRPRGTTDAPVAIELGLLPSTLSDAITVACTQRSFTDEGESVSISDAQLDLLLQLKQTFGFASARLEMRLLEKQVAADQETLRFGDLRFMFERLDGSIISHDELSYGQKRLLSFLYYLAMHPDTVIADELVDGLHHLWIVDAIDAIDDRQAFLASQNPLLLDYLEFTSAADVRSTFIQCIAKPMPDGERLTWSNMSEYDAERIFKAYQVGLQPVSEILRTKGLW